MSERKVLNVSTPIEETSKRREHFLNRLLCFAEILSAGLRSVEDPADEVGQEPPVHGSADGAVQHAMRDVRRVHLQGEEVQRPQRRRRRPNVLGSAHLPVLHQVHALPAGDLLQDRPQEH